ncbi:hypothetical protein PROFUN_10669 [Planoprotostelium fungivorum]|uniref:aspartyl aminopeptidase n=1 Tax=Planoprotostelium fungivorum TaxID=1890364 RepID=A0A2P6MUU6_9EUKA|nr:hypothetical protein PROFUN_10669 [Planoprotostelium fungivorum]
MTTTIFNFEHGGVSMGDRHREPSPPTTQIKDVRALLQRFQVNHSSVDRIIVKLGEEQSQSVEPSHPVVVQAASTVPFRPISPEWPVQIPSQQIITTQCEVPNDILQTNFRAAAPFQYLFEEDPLSEGPFIDSPQPIQRGHTTNPQMTNAESMETFPLNVMTDLKHVIYNMLVENYNMTFSYYPDPTYNPIVEPVTMMEVGPDGEKRYGFSFRDAAEPERRIPEMYALYVRGASLDREDQNSIFIQDLYKYYLRSCIELLSKYFDKRGKFTFLYQDVPLFIPGGNLRDAKQRIKQIKTRIICRPFCNVRRIAFKRTYNTLTMSNSQDYLPLGQKFIDFVNASPTSYHAVDTAKKHLLEAGFTHLKEKDAWDLKPNGKYFFTRNQSTISAFILGGKWTTGNGVLLVGAHTDSPNLQVKPNAHSKNEGYLQLNVSTYGGGLWTTWFDRDLGLAGRVIVKDGDKYEGRLVRIDRPILRIPTLAVHLDRESSNKLEFNKQDQLIPILSTAIMSELNQEYNENTVLVELIAKEMGVAAENIKDFEIHLYDTQKSTIGGLFNEFIFSARLDNLCMSFCSLQSLLEYSKNSSAISNEKNVVGITLFDHEECGSDSAQGAGSPMVNELFRRLNPPHLVEQSVRRSFLISADMAHAVHPNYATKHEKNHKPQMHHGVVIKTNNNQRYATNSETGFLLKEIARRNNIPTQDFVVRNDVMCGSTIGPIIASGVGIRTVDIGNPQLSMHSIRETCGTADLTHAVGLLGKYFEEFTALDETVTID